MTSIDYYILKQGVTSKNKMNPNDLRDYTLEMIKEHKMLLERNFKLKGVKISKYAFVGEFI